MKGHIMSNSIQSLYSFLAGLGKITKPKKDNAKGVIIYNPQPFSLQDVELLAEENGLSVIHTPLAREYQGRTIPPSLFVGVIANELSEDEAMDFLSSLS